MSNKGKEINNQVLRPNIRKKGDFRQRLFFFWVITQNNKNNNFENTVKLGNSMFGMYTNDTSMYILCYIHLEKNTLELT